MEKEVLIEILKKEMLPAMGCTEPAAAALAGAKAKEMIGQDRIVSAQVSASRDMVKNAMGVGLPNCSLKGILAAVALGIAKGDTSKTLSILSDITEEQTQIALTIPVSLSLVHDVPALYVSVHLISENHVATATISGEHDRFSHVELDGNVLVNLNLEDSEDHADEKQSSSKRNAFLKSLTLDDIIDFASYISADDVPFIMEAIFMNSKICHHSLVSEYGLQVGKTALDCDCNTRPVSLDEAFKFGAAWAAAGSDARMSGCSMPVIINSGSGNQGITVTVPVSVLATYLGASMDSLAQAVCVSELVGLVLTARKNRLSALCGAFTASIGTACAYVYLLGGDRSVMDKAINTMVGNMTGIICDGAKNTCALKIHSCLEAAALSVKLAFRGLAPDAASGIVGQDSLESIDYLSRISSEGMQKTDETIVSIMLNKQC